MSYGSQRWFPYTTDKGIIYGKLADESNVETIVPAANGQVVPAGTEALPPSIISRMTYWKAADGSTKSVPIMLRATFDLLTEGNVYPFSGVGDENAAPVNYTLIRKTPEMGNRKPVQVDTGKLDGDQP